jgi:hypothetical protein
MRMVISSISKWHCWLCRAATRNLWQEEQEEQEEQAEQEEHIIMVRLFQRHGFKVDVDDVDVDDDVDDVTM